MIVMKQFCARCNEWKDSTERICLNCGSIMYTQNEYAQKLHRDVEKRKSEKVAAFRVNIIDDKDKMYSDNHISHTASSKITSSNQSANKAKMFCPHCKEWIEETGHICPKCCSVMYNEEEYNRKYPHAKPKAKMYCAHCKEWIVSDGHICPRCCSELYTESEYTIKFKPFDRVDNNESETITESSQGDNAVKQFCPKCQKWRISDGEFCTKCGTKMKQGDYPQYIEEKILVQDQKVAQRATKSKAGSILGIVIATIVAVFIIWQIGSFFTSGGSSGKASTVRCWYCGKVIRSNGINIHATEVYNGGVIECDYCGHKNAL